VSGVFTGIHGMKRALVLCFQKPNLMDHNRQGQGDPVKLYLVHCLRVPQQCHTALAS